ncbi:hypothetical protein HRbin39_00490 [bacterium HR39]|nr:hypothetical protein HRbin39_00490 [bacterium HR39]
MRDPASGTPHLAGRLDRLEADPWLDLPPDARTAWVRQLAPLSFELEVEHLTLGGLYAGRVTARGGLAADGQLALDGVRADEVAGGRAVLSGEVDVRDRRLRIAGQAGVPVPARLWRMLAGEPPSWLGLFDATTLDFDHARDGDVRTLRLRARTEDLTLSLETQEAPQRRILALALEAPATEALLLRLGVPPGRPEAWRTPLRASWREERDAEGLVRLNAGISGPLAPLRLALARRADGTLSGSLDGDALPPLSVLETLWTAAARLLPLPPAPPTTWPGAWPEVRFDPRTLAALPRLEVAVRLGGGLRARLLAREGALAVEDLRLAAADVDLTGGVRIGTADGAVTAASTLAVRVGRIRDLPRLARLFQRVDGGLELEAELRTRGASLPALVAGLTGEARIALARGRLRDLAYDPASRTFRPSPGEALTLGPIEASCTLAGGIARCRAPLVALGEAGSFDLAAEIDLAAFAAHLRLVPAGGGRELVLSGPLGALAPASARRAQSEGPSIFSGRTMASNSPAVR